jgi:hypothetical protein
MLSTTTENQIKQEWVRKAERLEGGFTHHPVMTVTYEYTDTFGGEANYSWVKRGEFQDSSGTPDRLVVRKVKALAGLTGVRCKRTDHGDMIELRPYGSATVLFITFS